MTVPTGVLAIPMGRSILVVWDANPAIEYYNIYRSFDGVSFDIVMTFISSAYITLGSMPIEVPIWIKVDGILPDGQYTDKVDAKLGERTSDVMTVEITTTPGSTILEDSLVALRASVSFAGGDTLIRFPNEVNF